MATDEDTESGGQTDDAGETDDTEDTTPVDDGADPVSAKDDGEKQLAVPRKARRVHHMRAAAEAKAAAERERDEYRQRLSQIEQQNQELQRRVEARERQSQQQDTTAQTKEKIGALRRQAQTHLAMSSQLKGQEAQKEWDEWQRLNDEANDLRDDLRDEARWAKRQGEIQQSMPNQELMTERQYFEAKYPWVATSVEGRSLADGRFSALVRSGRPATRQTMEEAVTYAARALRLGGTSAPSEASRQRYAGFAQRDGEADDGAASGTMSPEEVENNLHFKRMALGAYPQLEPRQAYAKWAKEIGSKAKRADA